MQRTTSRRSASARRVAGLLLAGVVLPTAGGGAAIAPRAEGPGLCELLQPVLRVECGDATPPPPPAPQSQPQTPEGKNTASATAASTQQFASAAAVRRTPTTVRYDPKRLAVTFKSGTPRATVDRVFARAAVTLEQAIPALSAYMVGVDPGRRDSALASIRSSAAVAHAAPEVLVEALGSSPDDGLLPEQWGLRLAGFPQAWGLIRSTTRVVVAVVDTGVDPGHPDLQGALVAGYDFVNHTAGAGLLAARSITHTGPTGVCGGSCVIMPIKVLDQTGVGDDSVIAAGIVWAADHGARVINLSLGGPGSTPELSAAVSYALAKGSVVIAAAGNSASTVPFFPAADPLALSVAGTTESDHPYPWTDFGSWVKLAAPGCNLAPARQGGYGYFCGTSSATPIVSGLAALALAANPAAAPAEVEQALESPAVPISGLVQYGRINAPATLSLLAPATPAAPAAGATFSGTVTRESPTRSYTHLVPAGPLSVTLRFTGAPSLSLTLKDEHGVTSRAAGRSPLRFRRTLPAGAVRLVVRGARIRTSFTLTINGGG